VQRDLFSWPLTIRHVLIERHQFVTVGRMKPPSISSSAEFIIIDPKIETIVQYSNRTLLFRSKYLRSGGCFFSKSFVADIVSHK
jgi:hypothetical protein